MSILDDLAKIRDELNAIIENQSKNPDSPPISAIDHINKTSSKSETKPSKLSDEDKQKLEEKAFGQGKDEEANPNSLFSLIKDFFDPTKT